MVGSAAFDRVERLSRGSTRKAPHIPIWWESMVRLLARDAPGAHGEFESNPAVDSGTHSCGTVHAHRRALCRDERGIERPGAWSDCRRYHLRCGARVPGAAAYAVRSDAGGPILHTAYLHWISGDRSVFGSCAVPIHLPLGRRKRDARCQPESRPGVPKKPDDPSASLRYWLATTSCSMQVCSPGHELQHRRGTALHLAGTPNDRTCAWPAR